MFGVLLALWLIMFKPKSKSRKHDPSWYGPFCKRCNDPKSWHHICNRPNCTHRTANPDGKIVCYALNCNCEEFQ